MIDSIVTTDVTCSGANDGSICIYVSGGTADYTYQLFNGPLVLSSGPQSVTSYCFTGLGSGVTNYQVIVVGEDGGSAYLIDSASSPTRLQTYKATDQLEPLVSSRRIVQASLHSTAIKGSVTLSKVEVGDIAIGAGFLGSGGGGRPVLGYQLALNTLSRGEKIRTVSLSHLPDDALVVVFGVMGSPVVVDERPPLFL